MFELKQLAANGNQSARLILNSAADWNPDQPRDEQGRFGEGGRTNGKEAAQYHRAESAKATAEGKTGTAFLHERAAKLHEEFQRQTEKGKFPDGREANIASNVANANSSRELVDPARFTAPGMGRSEKEHFGERDMHLKASVRATERGKTEEANRHLDAARAHSRAGAARRDVGLGLRNEAEAQSASKEAYAMSIRAQS